MDYDNISLTLLPHLSPVGARHSLAPTGGNYELRIAVFSPLVQDAAAPRLNDGARQFEIHRVLTVSSCLCDFVSFGNVRNLAGL
jgi:hypothetical protein